MLLFIARWQAYRENLSVFIDVTIINCLAVIVDAVTQLSISERIQNMKRQIFIESGR